MNEVIKHIANAQENVVKAITSLDLMLNDLLDNKAECNTNIIHNNIKRLKNVQKTLNLIMRLLA